VIAAVSAIPPAAVAMTRTNPGVVGDVKRPAAEMLPLVAFHVTVTGWVDPSDMRPLAENCCVPPVSNATVAGETLTLDKVMAGEGTATVTTAVSASIPFACRATTRKRPTVEPAVYAPAVVILPPALLQTTLTAPLDPSDIRPEAAKFWVCPGAIDSESGSTSIAMVPAVAGLIVTRAESRLPERRERAKTENSPLVGLENRPVLSTLPPEAVQSATVPRESRPTLSNAEN